MTRGSVVIVAGGADYTGKPRPAVVVGSELFAIGTGVTLCPMTSTEHAAELLRVRVEPSSSNGLDRVSWIMVEKISTVHQRKLSPQIGVLTSTDMRALSEALALYLGFASRASA